MSILVDTNILLRRTPPDHESHSIVQNGLGFFVALAASELAKIKQVLIPAAGFSGGLWRVEAP
jgi:hypothetical protein